MGDAKDTKSGVIEVWLRSDGSGLEIICTVVDEDETTYQMPVESLSMRGAKREITGDIIDMGYTPVGRWRTEADFGDGPAEVVRRFRSS